MHDIPTAFIDAITATPSAPPIIAIFKDREPVTYTAAILELLKPIPPLPIYATAKRAKSFLQGGNCNE